MNEVTTPSVFWDHSRHTAIVLRTIQRIKKKQQDVEIIPMDSSGLRTLVLPVENFLQDFRQMNYHVKEAATKYLRSSIYIPITTRAKAALEAIVGDKSLDDLPTDELIPVKPNKAESSSVIKDVDGIPLKQICADLDIDPSLARRILRSSNLKKDGRWVFNPEAAKKVYEILKAAPK